MAFRFLHGSKVRNNFFRFHNNLAQKKNTRANDLTDQTHHTYNGMYLWQVSAGSIQFLPDIRHCIDSDNVNSFIGKEQEIIHHLIEHTWISVV